MTDDRKAELNQMMAARQEARLEFLKNVLKDNGIDCTKDSASKIAVGLKNYTNVPAPDGVATILREKFWFDLEVIRRTYNLDGIRVQLLDNSIDCEVASMAEIFAGLELFTEVPGDSHNVVARALHQEYNLAEDPE